MQCVCVCVCFFSFSCTMYPYVERFTFYPFFEIWAAEESLKLPVFVENVQYLKKKEQKPLYEALQKVKEGSPWSSAYAKSLQFIYM